MASNYKIGTAEDIAETPTQAQAIYHPNSQVRANAKQELRANSGLTPDGFKKLDSAFKFGYYQPKIQSNDDGTVSANAQLMDWDEWVNESDEVGQEVRVQVSMLDDLVNAGYTVSSDLSYPIYARQEESEWDQDAEISMDGMAQSQEDMTAKKVDAVAQPIIHFDYSISSRTQMQSDNIGDDVETRQAREAGRKIREGEEQVTLDGWGNTISHNGTAVSVEGYRNTDAKLDVTSTGDWSEAPAEVLNTFDAVLQEVETQMSDDNGTRNPDPQSQGMWVYHNPAVNSTLREEDPRGDGNMNLRERINQDYGFLDLRPAGFVPEDEVLFVMQDPRFVEVVIAQSPSNLSWEIQGGMATSYKALSSRVPMFHQTYSGIKGIAHVTGA